MPLLAPRFLARASFSSLDDVMTTCRPIAWGSCSPKIETPPVPCIRTVWPAMTLPCSTKACHAVTAPQGNVAPSSTDRGAGIFTTPSSSSTTYSASMPSMLPPRALACTSGGASPPDQRWKKQPATLSPTFTRVTPAPHLRHLAGAVGKRDDIIPNRHPVGAAHDAEIAEVERTRHDLNQHLAIGWLGIGALDFDQRLDAGATFRQLIGTHVFVLP